MAQIGPLLEMCRWDDTHYLYKYPISFLSFRHVIIVSSVPFHLAAIGFN